MMRGSHVSQEGSRPRLRVMWHHCAKPRACHTWLCLWPVSPYTHTHTLVAGPIAPRLPCTLHPLPTPPHPTCARTRLPCRTWARRVTAAAPPSCCASGVGAGPAQRACRWGPQRRSSSSGCGTRHPCTHTQHAQRSTRSRAGHVKRQLRQLSLHAPPEQQDLV